MCQIIFLNPFPKTLITGGIKTCYSHADLLVELGFKVKVFQPDGPPEWLPPKLQALTSITFAAGVDDTLVFPEVLNGWLADIAKTPTAAKKVMFCQNQYYMFSYGFTAEAYAEMGFTHFIAPSAVAKRMIESVLKLRGVSVIPPIVDPGLFFPHEKTMQIATVPRKFPWLPGGIPAQATLLQTIFALKYPHLRSVSWQMLENKSEQETVAIIGRSMVFLALSYMEACPLVPLEAMASGCIVVGYTGYGGLEYASSQNGFWFSPEQLEEVVDTIATVIEGLSRGDQRLIQIAGSGIATAARFSKQHTKEALKQVYSLFAKPSM